MVGCMNTQDAEALYRQLGRLIESMPRFFTGGQLSPEALQWLGRVQALVKESGELDNIVDMNTAMSMSIDRQNWRRPDEAGALPGPCRRRAQSASKCSGNLYSSGKQL